MTDHQMPEDPDQQQDELTAPPPHAAFSPADPAEPVPAPRGSGASSPFVPPPGPPPVAVEPAEGKPSNVSGNGHHHDDVDGDQARTREWIPAAPEEPKADPAEPDDLEAIPVREDLPMDKQLEALLLSVITQGGSDLHLVAGAPPFVRTDGRLIAAAGWEPLSPDAVETMVTGILTERQAERLREDLELNAAHSLPEARFRVNVHFQRGSMAAAFHLVPYRLPSVEELGLPPIVEDLARLRSGLVIAAGPSGSGKSTTLAAMIDVANSEREASILTIEDPIEFLHRHKRSAVSQREVGPDTRSFADALEQALRQDPDVVMVGEMRDTDTIAMALTAAEAGHLVLASLHTRDSAQSVDRLIDVFPPHQQQHIRVQLSLTLQGVVAQQLVPAAEGERRIVACEVLVGTSTVSSLIREGKTDQIRSAILSGRKLGMVAMDATLAQLLHDGRITRDTAFDYAHSPDQLAKQLSSGYAGGLPTVTG